jgi:hypothetical protein
VNSWRSTSRSAPYLTSNSRCLQRRTGSLAIRTGTQARTADSPLMGSQRHANSPRRDSAPDENKGQAFELRSTLPLTLERVTGIEPALSAWESVPSGPVTCPDLRFGVSASDRERPLVTGVNGPLMARQIAARPAPIAVPDPPPSFSIAAIPRAARRMRVGYACFGPGLGCGNGGPADARYVEGLCWLSAQAGDRSAEVAPRTS